MSHKWNTDFSSDKPEHVRRQGAEEEQQPDKNGWLPIESAPRDGTPIWLCGYGIYHGIEFVAHRRDAQYPGDEPHWWNLNAKRRVPDHCPTHWRFRPTPPETSHE